MDRVNVYLVPSGLLEREQRQSTFISGISFLSFSLEEEEEEEEEKEEEEGRC